MKDFSTMPAPETQVLFKCDDSLCNCDANIFIRCFYLSRCCPPQCSSRRHRTFQLERAAKPRRVKSCVIEYCVASENSMESRIQTASGELLHLLQNSFVDYFICAALLNEDANPLRLHFSHFRFYRRSFYFLIQ